MQEADYYPCSVCGKPFANPVRSVVPLQWSGLCSAVLLCGKGLALAQQRGRHPSATVGVRVYNDSMPHSYVPIFSSRGMETLAEVKAVLTQCQNWTEYCMCRGKVQTASVTQTAALCCSPREAQLLAGRAGFTGEAACAGAVVYGRLADYSVLHVAGSVCLRWPWRRSIWPAGAPSATLHAVCFEGAGKSFPRASSGTSYTSSIQSAPAAFPRCCMTHALSF